jgi:cytochrome c oxidase cbb3-type subunit 3
MTEVKISAAKAPGQPMPKSKLFWFALILLVSFSSLAQRARAQDDDDDDEKPATKAAAQGSEAERGQKLFQQNCGVCHANDATGGRGPDLIRSPITAHDEKGDQIGKVIHEGRPDKGMPPMPLTDNEVADIAAFLHARIKESLQSARVPKVYAIERLLTGNAEAGKAYFDGPGGCKSCHSPTGDLAGVGAKYTPIDLQARILYPEKLFKNTKTTAVVTLPSGQKVQGHVVYQDDFAVGLTDSNGWYRSVDRTKNKIELKDGLAGHREQLFKLTPDQVHNLFAYIQTLK